MTHEELLQEINERLSKCDCLSCNYEYAGFKALRAIVELHKPKRINTGASTENGFEHWQEVCSKCIFPYPCQTIQTIKKELA